MFQQDDLASGDRPTLTPDIFENMENHIETPSNLPDEQLKLEDQGSQIEIDYVENDGDYSCTSEHCSNLFPERLDNSDLIEDLDIDSFGGDGNISKFNGDSENVIQSESGLDESIDGTNNASRNDSRHASDEEDFSDLFQNENTAPDDLMTRLNNRSDCTKQDALYMLLALHLRHQLTWATMESILLLFRTIIGDDILPKSKYGFLIFFLKNGQNYVFYFYCYNCEAYVGDTKDILGMDDMKCKICHATITMKDMNQGCFFVYYPLKNQLLNFLAGNESNIEWSHSESIEQDIYDFHGGDLYKSSQGRFEKTLTLTVNTDGARKFRSTNNSQI